MKKIINNQKEYKRKLSIGIIVTDSKNENMLMGKVTPTPKNSYDEVHFDIPKGAMEDDDVNFLSCCLRELYEETGMVIDKEDIKFIEKIGFVKYNNNKRLYLFYFHDKDNKYLNDESFNKLYCHSEFIDVDGKSYKEMSYLKMFPLDLVFDDDENDFMFQSLKNAFKTNKLDFLNPLLKN